MSTMKAAAVATVTALCVAAPALSHAGGEIQEYTRTSTSTTASNAGASTAAAPYSNYAPPPSYVRPMSMYYGAPYGPPCPTLPYGHGGYGYGYGYGGGQCGGGGGSMPGDLLTAGLLGLGIGYLIF
jgi:hypothetical protein